MEFLVHGYVPPPQALAEEVGRWGQVDARMVARLNAATLAELPERQRDVLRAHQRYAHGQRHQWMQYRRIQHMLRLRRQRYWERVLLLCGEERAHALANVLVSEAGKAGVYLG
jgi:hypothetical protein